MNKQISNVITQLRVISTIVIVVYHAACPYGGWEAFTATISNNISSMNIINLIFQKLLCNDMLPMFFSLSGMLFYGKKDTYKDTLLVFWTYLNCDKIVYGGKACKIPSNKLQHRLWITKQILKDIRCDYKVFNFIFSLRMHEYYFNKSHQSYFDRIALAYWAHRHQSLGYLLGFDIPINVFGPGLRINHWGMIVVNGNARIGAFCDIHQGVNIGNHGNSDDVPEIGNNVWIGPGAKLFGKIHIADGCAIGANAVVNRSFNEPNKSVAGIPAKIVSDKGNRNIRVYTNTIN